MQIFNFFHYYDETWGTAYFNACDLHYNIVGTFSDKRKQFYSKKISKNFCRRIFDACATICRHVYQRFVKKEVQH